MPNFLRLAVLKKGSQNYSGNTILQSELFDTAKMDTPMFAFLNPWTSSALGAASNANDIIKPVGVAPAGAFIGMDFTYRHTSSHTERYFVSCLSTDVVAALTSVNPQMYTAITPANSFTTY